jgi:hypothetical protein
MICSSVDWYALGWESESGVSLSRIGRSTRDNVSREAFDGCLSQSDHS